jgi:hypothetical protein
VRLPGAALKLVREPTQLLASGQVEPAEAQAVLGLVLMLGGPRRAQASHALAQLLDGRIVLRGPGAGGGLSVGRAP